MEKARGTGTTDSPFVIALTGTPVENRLDELWVPTEFHKQVFTQHGVSPDKIFTVGEAVDAAETSASIPSTMGSTSALA